MPVSPDYEDAYVHYLTQFPSLESLGEGTPPATWKAELDRVSASAFDAILATNANLEGGNVSGVLNFRQRNLVRALHAVRGLRDSEYVNPYSVEIPDPKPGRRFGSVVVTDGPIYAR